MLTPLSELMEKHKTIAEVQRAYLEERKIWSINRSKHIPSVVHYSGVIGGPVLRDAYPNPVYHKYHLKPGFHWEEFVH